MTVTVITGVTATGVTPPYTIRSGGQALAQAATRRIDVIQMSDSNSFHFNAGNSPPDLQAGWEGGWPFALFQKYGLYASMMLSPAENFGNYLPVRGWASASQAGSGIVFSGAGGIADQFETNGAIVPALNYQYIASGAAAQLGLASFITGASFTASITGGVMTVTAIANGVITLGATITSGGTGTVASYGPNTVGGTGTYNLTGTANVGSTAMTSRNDGGPWKPNNHLRFHYATANFNTGSGWLQPLIRRDDAVFNTYVTLTKGTFTAKIDNGSGVAGNILTVTAYPTSGVPVAPLQAGDILIAGGAAAGTQITAQLSYSGLVGSGTLGTYAVSGAAQLVASNAAFAAAPGTNDGIGNSRIVFGSLDLPANTAGLAQTLGCRTGVATTSPVGPFLHYYSRLEDPNATVGASCHNLYGVSLQGLWDFARNLIYNTPDLALWMIFNEARRLQVAQGLTPIIVMIINSGVNDNLYGTNSGANQSPSWGPLNVPSATTVTAGSAVIAAPNFFVAGQPMAFANGSNFGTVTGLAANTTYYVSATGLSPTQFEISATLGGAVIVPGGSGTATPTIAGSSAPHYVDNLTAIKQRIEGLYARYWPISELSWVIMPSHPQSTPDNAFLLSYRAAVKTWTQSYPNTSYIDLNALATFATANAAGWIDSGGTTHLSSLGYLNYAVLALNDVTTR